MTELEKMNAGMVYSYADAEAVASLAARAVRVQK